MTAPLRVLVVDDVALARQRLARLLSAIAGVELVGCHGDVAAARRALPMAAPDLVLLDVDMPGEDGMALARGIGTEGPAIVFTTAHAQFALQAFRVGAVDYLLKPIEAASLREAIERVRSRRGGGAGGHLVLRERDQVRCLPMDSIDWIESAGNYACIRAGGQVHVHRETLSRLEARLDPARFQRIHRSRIVNVSRVAGLKPLHNGDHRLTLVDGSELVMSRTYREALFARLPGHG